MKIHVQFFHGLGVGLEAQQMYDLDAFMTDQRESKQTIDPDSGKYTKGIWILTLGCFRVFFSL